MSGGSASHSEWHAHIWASAWVRLTLLCGGQASVLTPRIGLTLIDTCSPFAWQRSLLRKVNKKWQQWLTVHLNTTHTFKRHTNLSETVFFLEKRVVVENLTMTLPRAFSMELLQPCRFSIETMVKKVKTEKAFERALQEGVELEWKTETDYSYVLI